MKKSLLLGVVALIASGSVQAATPQKIENFNITCVSPDGRYVVSELYGAVVIIKDLQQDKDYVYACEEGVTDYSIGHGNAFSDNGIMVGSTVFDGDAAYWRDGEWHQIEVAKKYPMRFTNAITKDGSMIVGDVWNLENTLGNDGLMMVPSFWLDADGDGVYESETLLPYPDKDLFNGIPQYVNAINVSGDGKVIVGQVVASSGFFIYPIAWKQDAEGKYQYYYPGIELFNPNHLEIPQDPGPQPSMPNEDDYMTAEQLEAYNAAYMEWAMNGYEGVMPEKKDFMSPEQKAAYEAAYAAYVEAQNIWYPKYLAFEEASNAIMRTSPNYVFNTCSMSRNGKYMAQVCTQEGEEYWDPSFNYTMQFDLENGTVKKFPASQNVAPYEVLDNGTVLGAEFFSMMSSTMPSQAYIANAENSEYALLADYLKTADPATYQWLDENMRFNVETVDADYNLVTLENYLVTGTPHCSADMSTIALSIYPVMFWESDYEALSVIITGLQSGVKDVIGKADIALKASKGGVFTIDGEATSLTVYDLNGRTVFATNAPASIVETGLGSGLYIAKATDAKGNTSVVKVAF